MNKQRQRAIAKALTALMPGVPYIDAIEIRAMAYEPHMKALPPTLAVRLAAVAYIRHRYTPYDTLLDEGYDSDSARFFTSTTIEEKLHAWRANFSLQTGNFL